MSQYTRQPITASFKALRCFYCNKSLRFKSLKDVVSIIVKSGDYAETAIAHRKCYIATTQSLEEKTDER